MSIYGPVRSGGAVTKDYVDTQDAATKDYADLAAHQLVRKAGDTMAGQLDMGRNRIVGLGTPSDPADASTAGFVLETALILEDGVISRDGTPSATMQANLNLGFNCITAVADPHRRPGRRHEGLRGHGWGADIRQRVDGANKHRQAVCRPIGENSHTPWSTVPLPLWREQQCLEPRHWSFHSPHRWGIRCCGELADQVEYSWRQPQ